MSQFPESKSSGEQNRQLAQQVTRMQEQFEDLLRHVQSVFEHLMLRRHVAESERDFVMTEIRRRVWRALHDFDIGRSTNVTAYVWQTADRAILDWLRKAGRVRPLEAGEDFPDSAAPSPEARVRRKDSLDLLVKALGKLSSDKRAHVLVLSYFFDDITYADIARIMRLPNASAARQLKYHALKELRGIVRGKKGT